MPSKLLTNHGKLSNLQTVFTPLNHSTDGFRLWLEVLGSYYIVVYMPPPYIHMYPLTSVIAVTHQMGHYMAH